MDWANEEYVRLYVRDTDDWLCMPWQSRVLIPLLMRKMDRSGVIETKRGAKGVAVLLSMPVEIVEVGLSGLLEDGCLVSHGIGYALRNFVSAQNASKSDKVRQRDSRDRRRAHALSDRTQVEPVTNGHDLSRDVTAVTICHSPIAPIADPIPPITPSQGVGVVFEDLGDQRRAITGRVAKSHVRRFNDLRHALGEPGRPITHFESESALKALLETYPSMEGVEGDCMHCLDAKEAEAQATKSLRYFGPGMWKASVMSTSKTMTVDQARAGPKAPGKPIEPVRKFRDL